MTRAGPIYFGGSTVNPDSLAHFAERSITRPRIADTVQLCVGSAVCKRSGELENIFRSAGQSYSANSMPDERAFTALEERWRPGD